jgi:alanyl-tRNA synthetase
LRMVLGQHVEQKGSLVNDDYLRFDFSHFASISDSDLVKIEKTVNQKIRDNIHAKIEWMPIVDAKKTGAMALFGEKYGDTVRVVTFDKKFSIELCGGCHVQSTGEIGFFKIISESAIAAGIRRIEAITSVRAEEYIRKQDELLREVREALRNPPDLVKSVVGLQEENHRLQKEVQSFHRQAATVYKSEIKQRLQKVGVMNFVTHKVKLDSADEIKNMLFELRNEVPDLFCALGAEVNGKASISVIIAENLVKDKNYNAAHIVKEVSPLIKGGGGGQAFYAQAGGSDIGGLNAALNRVREMIA